MNNILNMVEFEKKVAKGEATWWQMELPSGDVFFGDEKTKMLGYSNSNFKNFTDFTNLLADEDKDRAMQAMRDHLSGEKDIYETDYKIKTASGEYIRFYDCGQIVNREGDKITLMGFVLKIDNNSNPDHEMQEFKNLILKSNPSIIDLVAIIK